MLDKLAVIGRSPWYWLAVIVLGISMEVIALIYQYLLDYLPCVLCIHVRIWVLGFILVAVFALIIRHHRVLNSVAHVLNTVMMIGFLERSWMSFAVERGLVFGSCDMESGLPSWFALDVWFPKLFKVWEACGYTPVLLFGITMAEALLLLSAAMVFISAGLAVVSIIRLKRDI